MAIVTKLELMERNSAFVMGIARASEHALESGRESVDARCSDFLAYFAGYISRKNPNEAERIRKLFVRGEK